MFSCRQNASAPQQKPVPPFLAEVQENITHLDSMLALPQTTSKLNYRDWEALANQLKVAHKEMNEANMTDWENRFHSQPQSLEDYVNAGPVRPYGKRQYIYVGKLGSFTAAQNNIFELTKIYLQAFYGVRVKYLDSIPLAQLQKDVRRRRNPHSKQEQLYSVHILERIMFPRLPDDAINYLLFTASDLYPGSNWNFVFGQANIQARVGVWSLYRYGDPDLSKEAFDLCLKRTLKTAVHETGHTFSIKHCTFYHCVMQGAYHLKEADERPQYVGPICLAKIGIACKPNPIHRFQQLHTFWSQLGFEEEADNYREFLSLLQRSLE